MHKLKNITFLFIIALLYLFIYSCSDISNFSSSAGNLSFYIRDESGNPLNGAKVVSQNSPENQLKVTGITNNDGVVLFSGIKAGSYEFQISRFDYEPQTADVVVSSGVNNIVTITLEKSIGY
ncbi:MAG: carboxypeptidase-like regulatory domain-containing protein [Dehalococcoidales bacterium]|nr:carboxypeptidase-like regulatory domain-containing protein [Dehalococcoidales bacterium]